MKLTVSSRLPAVLKANEPWPRSGAVRKPVAGCGATEPGHQRPEIDEMAAVQRDLLHRLLVDHRPERGGDGLDRRRLADHRHLLGAASDRQLDVLHRGLRHLDAEVLHHRGLEARALHLEPIAPDWKRGHEVLALAVADGGALLAGRQVLHRDRSTGDDGPLIVGDAPAQARRRLRVGGRGERQQQRGGGRRPPRTDPAHGTGLLFLEWLRLGVADLAER